MHRLLTTTDSLLGDCAVLSRDAMNHLKVIRPRDGEEIELFDGNGASRVFVFSRDGGSLIAKGEVIRVLKRSFELTLFACVTKGSRWDWTIEKATELGVSRIVPVISARTIVRVSHEEREAKCERWRRIAEEASRQSDAVWIPEINLPVTFDESLSLVSATTCFVGALTNPPAKMLLDAVLEVRGICSKPPAVYVGPEGDFTPEELGQLLEIAIPTSFGPTILRAETAAVFAASVLSAAFT